MTKRTKRRIILMDSILILSVAALCSSSFAWYMSLRQVSASVSSLALESGINATFKYFSGNISKINDVDTPTGYQDVTGEGVTRKQVTDYTTEFIEVETTSNVFEMVDIFPDTRFTYAIEFTSGFTSDVSFSLTSYDPGRATEDENHSRKVNENNNPICLAEAIDIYVQVVSSEVELTADEKKTNSNLVVVGYEDPNKNATQNTIGESLIVDKFNFDYSTCYPSETDTGLAKPYELESFSVQPNYYYYIFFTIEFSNDPDTYYSYDSTDTNNIDYYTKTETGTSNVYQRLSFVINKLSILRK